MKQTNNESKKQTNKAKYQRWKLRKNGQSKIQKEGN